MVVTITLLLFVHGMSFLFLPGLSWAWTRSQIWFTWRLTHGMEVSAALNASPLKSSDDEHGLFRNEFLPQGVPSPNNEPSA